MASPLADPRGAMTSCATAPSCLCLPFPRRDPSCDRRCAESKTAAARFAPSCLRNGTTESPCHRRRGTPLAHRGRSRPRLPECAPRPSLPSPAQRRRRGQRFGRDHALRLADPSASQPTRAHARRRRMSSTPASCGTATVHYFNAPGGSTDGPVNPSGFRDCRTRPVEQLLGLLPTRRIASGLSTEACSTGVAGQTGHQSSTAIVGPRHLLSRSGHGGSPPGAPSGRLPQVRAARLKTVLRLVDLGQRSRVSARPLILAMWHDLPGDQQTHCGAALARPRPPAADPVGLRFLLPTVDFAPRRSSLTRPYASGRCDPRLQE
jgi:hypothetical protein